MCVTCCARLAHCQHVMPEKHNSRPNRGTSNSAAGLAYLGHAQSMGTRHERHDCMAHAEWNSTCHVTCGKLPNSEASLFGFSHHWVAAREIVQFKSAKVILDFFCMFHEVPSIHLSQTPQRLRSKIQLSSAMSHT